MEREVGYVWSPSQIAARREAKRKPLFYASINLWPFVGVLLIFFFLFMTGRMTIYPRWVAVVLAQTVHATSQANSLREDVMLIGITSHGEVYYRNSRIAPEDLPGLIHEAVQAGAERKVYLTVDERSKYGDAAAVVEQIRRAGISDICFLVAKVGG